jgi:VanZ family protein
LTRRKALSAIVCAIGSGIVFAAIELGQLFLPTRVPGPTDIFLGIIGSSLGLWIGRWLCAGYGVTWHDQPPQVR